MSGENNQLMKKEIPMAIILTIVTCGIYGIFWKAHQFKTVNMLIGAEKYSLIKWFLLSIVTCGLYTIYIEYTMGQDIFEIQTTKNIVGANQNLPVISLILCFFGLMLVADAIQQSELNKILDA